MFLMFEDSFGAAICIDSAFAQIFTVNPPANEKWKGRDGCWVVNIVNPKQEENVPYQSLYYKEKRTLLMCILNFVKLLRSN